MKTPIATVRAVRAVRALCAVWVLASAGCGADKASVPGVGADASPGGGDASPPGGDVVMCTTTGAVFPTFDKTCTTAGDCTIGIHQTDCCGSTLAIGMAMSEQARFAADEQICMSQYPVCGCPAAPTTAEDGRQAVAGTSIAVECQSRRCTTTVK